MRLLVLGGTVFVGRAVVDAALALKHRVTIFHRGHNPNPRPGEIEEVLGDRTLDLGPLRGRRFDAVIDTCGYRAAEIRASLAGIEADTYVYVSSASVYADQSLRPLREDQPTHQPPPENEERVQGEFYGPQKSGCEQVLITQRPERSLILRAGLLVGPRDPTDRFTYWALRMQEPGPVLAPDVANASVQFLDVRDFAEWMVRCAADGLNGVMNANGPRNQFTLRSFLEQAGPAEIRWTDEDLLMSRGLQPWSELPLWLPSAWNQAGMMDVDVSRSTAAGLVSRPLADTLTDTVQWARARGDAPVWDYGTRARSAVLGRAREKAVLASLTG